LNRTFKKKVKVEKYKKIATGIKRIWAYGTGLWTGVAYKVISKDF